MWDRLSSFARQIGFPDEKLGVNVEYLDSRNPRSVDASFELAEEFGPALSRADRLVVTSIYPAGEPPLAGVDARLIVRAVERAGGPEVLFADGWEDAVQLTDDEATRQLGKRTRLGPLRGEREQEGPCRARGSL